MTDRRLERIRFLAAVDRLISDELACPLCQAKRREYRAIPPERRPPALGPCYLHVAARDELIRSAR